MSDPRHMKRDYDETPQLIQTGNHPPGLPRDGDWDGLRRCLINLIQQSTTTDGLSVTIDPAVVTELIFQKGKLISSK